MSVEYVGVTIFYGDKGRLKIWLDKTAVFISKQQTLVLYQISDFNLFFIWFKVVFCNKNNQSFELSNFNLCSDQFLSRRDHRIGSL